MRRPTIFISRHSAGLDDMKRHQQRDWELVLRHLHKERRFSVFEASANPVIASTMDALLAQGLIEVDNSPGYPWSNVKLTAAGLKMAGIKEEAHA